MKSPTPALLAGCALAFVSPLLAWTDSPPKLREIPGIEKSLVVTATPAAPKHGEQSVVRLKDGRLLLLWSEFLREDLLPADSPLWKLDNVILSPHIAGITPRYDDHMAGLFAENLRRHLAGEPLLNLVDRTRGY
jgi:hypothetical protein